MSHWSAHIYLDSKNKFTDMVNRDKQVQAADKKLERKIHLEGMKDNVIHFIEKIFGMKQKVVDEKVN